jgi:hypothetical protein
MPHPGSAFVTGVFFDPADPALWAAAIVRDAYQRAVAKIASRNLGEAFTDIPATPEQPIWKEAA